MSIQNMENHYVNKYEEESYQPLNDKEVQQLALDELKAALGKIFSQANKDDIETEALLDAVEEVYNYYNPDDKIVMEKE